VPAALDAAEHALDLAAQLAEERAPLEGAAIARREVRLADGPVRMSASIGVASHVSDEPLDAFLGRVDGALHAAKREGRDRVVEASAPTPLEAQA